MVAPEVDFKLSRRGKRLTLIRKIMAETLKAVSMNDLEAREYLLQVATDAELELTEMDKDYIKAYKQVMEKIN